MTEHQRILANLKQIADGVVALFGKNCEACVHDLSSLDNSLIYIQGSVTGRKAGAPATDLLVKRLQESTSAAQEAASYTSTTKDGRSLRSSTTLVRDSQGDAVAAFCINFDTTEFYNAHQALLPFLGIQAAETGAGGEVFATSMEETIEAMFTQAVAEIGRHPATMTVSERRRLIRILQDQGTFKLKGAVEEVATHLGVSKFTVYNYLKTPAATTA